MKNITERHEYILNKIKEHNKVSIQELCDEMNVSSVTIRKDLKLLEDKHLIFRTKGGASSNNPYATDKPLIIKESINYDEKNKIAKKAIELIKDNDSILIGSGTTASALARFLNPSDNKLTVITPALRVAIELCNKPNIEVLQLGGLIRPNSSSVAGQYAMRILDEISCGIVFLGVDGIDLDFGITISNLTEATLNQKMIATSQKVVILADSSKFGRRGLGKICNIEDVDYIVTDSNISSKYINALEESGLKVVIA
ncbi:DeoR/GlpR family DNA-binding transcription regulator [Sphingobacterium rhinopitheci]|uniref:DeoR/GlpR family DNA-binding transcription regulator n=1 Tax=Sphingobacterium rhinopitheci TaxID=2781960 RepID=UPI001F518F94|nr:DeoR/GlpR family DNA-binding transcription regulator [Sphingobacterium rhinopitheci]MCI0920144.1 DeoR/GlpR transcriptional regulator [Sphingobacterium rhinopitheci]